MDLKVISSIPSETSNFIKKEALAHELSWEFFEIFKTPFLQTDSRYSPEHLKEAVSLWLISF